MTRESIWDPLDIEIIKPTPKQRRKPPGPAPSETGLDDDHRLWMEFWRLPRDERCTIVQSGE